MNKSINLKKKIVFFPTFSHISLLLIIFIICSNRSDIVYVLQSTIHSSVKCASSFFHLALFCEQFFRYQNHMWPFLLSAKFSVILCVFVINNYSFLLQRKANFVDIFLLGLLLLTCYCGIFFVSFVAVEICKDFQNKEQKMFCFYDHLMNATLFHFYLLLLFSLPAVYITKKFVHEK